MPHTFTGVQSAQNNKTCQHPRRTALSLLIGGLLCSVAPAWADCVVSGTPNADGGVDMTCEGSGISQDTNLLGNGQNNNVKVQGDTTISVVYGGHVYSDGGGDVIVAGNTVILNGSSVSVDHDVFGGFGYAYADDNATVTVTGNSVTLNGSAAASVIWGGRGHSKVTATVAGNSVTPNNNSSVSDVIYGGYGTYGNNDITTVSGNSVTLNDSSNVYGSIYGGYGYGYNDYSFSNGDVRVTGNTVNINNTAAVSGSLYGGYINNFSDNATWDAFTGNTLNFAAAPITLSGTLANFENYNFTADPAFVNTDTSLITADTITFGTDDTNLKGGEDNTSKIQVVGIKSGNELFADDTFVLMRATGTLSGNAEGVTTRGLPIRGFRCCMMWKPRSTPTANG